MSFSSTVKEELMGIYGNARHCRIAELAAIVHFAGKNGNQPQEIDVPVENEYASSKYFTLLKKTFNINSVDDSVLNALKLKADSNGKIILRTITDNRLLNNSCCRRAYLRGLFISAGSLSDPQKGYHLEFVCDEETQVKQIIEILSGFGIEAHNIIRKKYYVVYIKEGEAIVDFLNIIGAHTSLMDLENMRILKEISNDINRRVNCETANIAKTVNAASKQIEDIMYIRDNFGFDVLPDKLREIAEVRLENPEASLKELGELMDPPVGKSGVNHRLRKLSELADSLM